MTNPLPGPAVAALRDARSIMVVTGAGVSAESGIPTFRDEKDTDALWARFDPMDLATPEAFARDPELVTRWYEWRLSRCAECRPNPGHIALAQLESLTTTAGAGFTLLTQNVDGLHQQAGSREVHELHGSIRVWRCHICSAERPMPDPPFPEHPLRCTHCAEGIMRPGVVWFGEMLPAPPLAAAERALTTCDLFLSVGTSAVVYPAAAFAYHARTNGATVIEINRDPTPLTDLADLSLMGKAGEILPALVDAAFGEGRAP